MPKLVWVLYFMVNGQLHTSSPDIGEACLMNMLSRPAAQQAFCVNKETGAKMFPNKQ